VAVVVSSVAIVPLYLIVAVFTGDLDNMLLPVMLIAALCVSTAGVVIVGLPMHLILVRMGRVKAIYYAFFGFLVPTLVTVVIHPFGEDGFGWIIVQSISLGLFGAVIAVIFWKIVTYDSAT